MTSLKQINYFMWKHDFPFKDVTKLVKVSTVPLNNTWYDLVCAPNVADEIIWLQHLPRQKILTSHFWPRASPKFRLWVCVLRCLRVGVGFALQRFRRSRSRTTYTLYGCLYINNYAFRPLRQFHPSILWSCSFHSDKFKMVPLDRLPLLS